MGFVEHGFEEDFFGIGVLVIDLCKDCLHEFSVKNKVIFLGTFPQIVLHLGKAVIFSRSQVFRIGLHMLPELLEIVISV